MFEGVRASPGAGLRSCVIGSGCWNDCFSWFSAPAEAQCQGPCSFCGGGSQAGWEGNWP